MIEIDFMNHPSVRRIADQADNVCTFDFPTVYIEEVRKALKDLKPNKATGRDLIPSWVLKLGADELSSPLAILYNNCMGTCF